MNFVFIGGTYRGYKVFSDLIRNEMSPELVFILKEDEHEVMKYSDKMKELCEKHNLRCFITKKISREQEQIIKSKTYDFAIVCGWRTIINFNLNNQFKHGMLAAHDSLLPKYRGFAPLNWSIINGEKKTGVTLFQINEGEVDSGHIAEQEEVLIEENDYAVDVFEKITLATIVVVNKFISNFKLGKVNFTPQDHTKASYTCKRLPEDGSINWIKSSREIYNFIRGLAHPYPGAYVFYKDVKYAIRKANLGDYDKRDYVGRIPGRVVKIDKSGIEVLCGNGSVKITEWENTASNLVQNPADIIKSLATTF